MAAIRRGLVFIADSLVCLGTVGKGAGRGWRDAGPPTAWGKSLAPAEATTATALEASATATVEAAAATALEAATTAATIEAAAALVEGALLLELAGALLAEVAGIGVSIEPVLHFTRIRHMACRQVRIALAATTGTGTLVKRRIAFTTATLPGTLVKSRIALTATTLPGTLVESRIALATTTLPWALLESGIALTTATLPGALLESGIPLASAARTRPHAIIARQRVTGLAGDEAVAPRIWLGARLRIGPRARAIMRRPDAIGIVPRGLPTAILPLAPLAVILAIHVAVVAGIEVPVVDGHAATSLITPVEASGTIRSAPADGSPIRSHHVSRLNPAVAATGGGCSPLGIAIVPLMGHPARARARIVGTRNGATTIGTFHVRGTAIAARRGVIPRGTSR